MCSRATAPEVRAEFTRQIPGPGHAFKITYQKVGPGIHISPSLPGGSYAPAYGTPVLGPTVHCGGCGLGLRTTLPSLHAVYTMLQGVAGI